MEHFFLTFGQKYRCDPHPADDRIHPDGWFKIVAPDYEAARLIVTTVYGLQWSNLYTEAEFEDDRHYYSRGELAVIRPLNGV
jgi:hypothetical protein